MKLLFDIGGTKMRFALTEDNRSITNTQIYPTVQNYSQALEFIKTKTAEITLNNTIDPISGGIAGVVQNNVLFRAPHLEDWQQKPITTDFINIFGAKTISLQNDAALAGLAEATYGAGKDHNIVAYITIGTGVGGARITSRKIDESYCGFEPGHQIISFQDNKNVTFEELASGTAIKLKYGKAPHEIEDLEIWDTVEQSIAVGLYNITLMWSPDIIVLGGGVVNANHINIENVKKKLTNLNSIFPTIPAIQKCKLGEEVGLYGAMLSTIIT